ncbi:MAG: hypothetical protein ACR2FH_01190, partial [Caulobacteraceae bacterium]
MTTKTLNGNYPSGYTLSAGYSTVNITHYAYLQGTGLTTQALATVVNAGSIRATGGSGGTAVNLAFGGAVANTGAMRGGLGAAGSVAGGRGRPGAAGGAAVKAGAGATITNSGIG